MTTSTDNAKTRPKSFKKVDLSHPGRKVLVNRVRTMNLLVCSMPMGLASRGLNGFWAKW